MVDPTSYRELLRYDKPEFNHNGGTIAFGPDGLLYAALGDGGDANDVGAGHIPGTGNAQNLTTILGKMIRINPLDPRLTGTARRSRQRQRRSTASPRDNPFVATAPAPSGRSTPTGSATPTAFSFDTEDGRLDRRRRGPEQHRGGRHRHARAATTAGTSRRAHSSSTRRPATCRSTPARIPSLIDPVVEYDHIRGHGRASRARSPSSAASSTAGSRIPELRGKYIFADLTGFLFVADLETGKIAKLIDSGIFIKGFGQDEDGEIYVLGSSNSVRRGPAGMVLAIKPDAEGKVEGSRGSLVAAVEPDPAFEGPGDFRPGPAFDAESEHDRSLSPARGRNGAAG